MIKTITVRKRFFPWLQEHCIGSSEHGASLWGMRKTWWGADAYVARCDGYLFNLKEKDFIFLKNLSENP